MSHDLAAALQNPSVVMTAGPRKETRNSIKKANGLVRFGAALMLGAALLSPLNALAVNQQPPAWEQTTEVVAAADNQDLAGFETMTVAQLEHMQDRGQTPDWFNIQVEGRTWNNADTSTGTTFDVPAWIQYGKIKATPLPITDLATQDAPALPPLVPGDGHPVEAEPAPRVQSYDERMAEFYAQQEARAITSRRDAPKFEIGRNPYNFHERVDLGGKEFKDASPAQQQEFVQRLVKDAYIELRAGHTVESPSQRLVNICQHVEEIAETAPVAGTARAQEVYKACQSDQMQSSMLANTTLKVAAGAGALLLAATLKGLAFGSMLMGANIFLSAARKREEDESGVSPVSAPSRTVVNPSAFDSATSPATSPTPSAPRPR